MISLTSHDVLPPSPPLPVNRFRHLTRQVEESFAGWPQVWSAWQDVPMTPWGYPMSAAPSARGASGTPVDRQGGRDIPLFWNEIDLRGFRVLSKFLTDTNQFGKGFLRRLVDYNVRKGYGWQACRFGAKKTAYPTVAASDPVIERGQTALDKFRDITQWPLKSREAFEKLQKYGEVFGRFGIYSGRPWFRFVGSDQVGNPTGDSLSPQSFGIETAPNDIEDRWAYHVWDVPDYPSEGEWVDADEFVFMKINVESDVKRGLPSFFPVQDNLDSVRQLLSSMIGSAVKMARVAWREKFPTASANQVSQLVPVNANPGGCGTGFGPGPYTWPNLNGFNSGDVIRVEGNREYEEGPTAAGVTNFIEAEQAALRGAAVSFGFPESIATGKIDDVNFAAALTTGAPFAIAIEGTQFDYGCRWERESALKALDLAVRLGWLTQDERRQLDVEVTAPSPLITEPDKETNRRKIMFDSKVLSGQTWQLMESLDPQHEEANVKAWEAAHPEPEVGLDAEKPGRDSSSSAA